MILNSEEIVSLVHFPSASVRVEKLVRDTRRTKAVPQIAIGNELELGYNTYRGRKTRVSLSRDQRLRHTFVAGATGSGKTTLLKAMIIADIEHGNGVCVIEPHGDLIDELLGHVPEHRHNDVIVVDPADDFPVPLNVLSGHNPLERTLLASDLTSIFRRLSSTTWGDQMDAVLNNAILAFVESDRGGTLFDLRRFLAEAEFRDEFLNSVADEEVLYFWRKQFPNLKGHPQAPILTRLSAFLRPKPIRQMVSQREGLDFRNIMDSNKILFVRLAQGAIGVENSHFLGSLILSKLHQIALSRQDIDESKRNPFFIFCDELQFFLSPSVAALLSGARKFGVGLTAATQEFHALWRMDQQVASAILANVYTRVCFRLSDIDAKRLRFSTFEASDLQNLGVGEAIARVERAEYDFNLTTSPVPSVNEEIAHRRTEQIMSLSRQRFARKRDPIEQESCDSQSAVIKSSGARNNISKSEPVGVVKPVFENQVQPSVRQIPSITPTQPLGRGGQQHKYLQNLIKRLAEDKGFRVTIEQSVLSGAGSVDVALERAGSRIACEISVSSTCDYEFKNIQKCLAAGFDQVIVLSAEKRSLVNIERIMESESSAESRAKVVFLQPEEFILFLDEMDTKQLNTEKTVRGYNVKVRHNGSKHSEQRAQRFAVSQVILQALKRLKGAN
jgi:DNA helicase HerA-like ATPase